MRKIMIFGLSAGMLSACGMETGEENNGTVNNVDNGAEGDGEINIIADSLQSPWSMQRNNNEWLLTERDGSLVAIEDGDVTDQSLQINEEVVQQAESGLLGFVLHPDFESNQQAYIYHTYETSEGLSNRVIQVVRDGNEWIEEEELLSGIPGAPTHNGGRLAIFEDELYVTTGDAEEPEWSQDVDNLAGKILKMNLDGTYADDMPMEDSYVWSYGHRNPQGLAWIEDGTMYSSEHGQTALDEINLIEPGENYGWPNYEGDETSEDTVAPVIHSGDDTWAPSGLTAHENDLYMAGLRGEAVYHFDSDIEELETFVEDFGRIRDVYVDDDKLYILTNNTDGRGNPDDTDDKLLEVELE
ncbi:PQQ-dependent sugar dehydrogenase [Alkalicoccobacillus murimartini]|uniref:Glucose/arabinose dehydrogenase n=1 Tax=Alkalicoccobacillus murimartini TaxID=171685 RepID=A0ABT9YE87_9BACI|nr:PQQ-dependent sugar dehydrogenase [Alkalicoccobacillus murimartini]MDQ0206168.1 glucose/arabinose dehydrogenase [Alkalicoccobacillus murimartini]